MRGQLKIRDNIKERGIAYGIGIINVINLNLSVRSSKGRHQRPDIRRTVGHRDVILKRGPVAAAIGGLVYIN